MTAKVAVTAIGAVAFFVLAPGTVAGYIPYALTGWRDEGAIPGGSFRRAAGAVLVLIGVASVVESFARFVRKGLGTPAPVAPPTRLVISGQYRYVRNPMYVAILAVILGQALAFGSLRLVAYAAALWAVFSAFVMVYEEPTLARTFGASYEAYRHAVRRWWPRATPWEEPRS